MTISGTQMKRLRRKASRMVAVMSEHLQQPRLDHIRNETSESEGEHPKRAADPYAVGNAQNGIAVITHAASHPVSLLDK